MITTEDGGRRVLVTADVRDSRKYAMLADGFTLVPLARAAEYLDNVQGVDSVWFTELALAHPGCADAATAASSALQRSGRPVVLGRVYPPLTR